MKGWFALLLAMMGASSFGEKRSGDYWYTLDEAGNAIITDWEGDDIDLTTIPSDLDGHRVTAIGDYAFQRNDYPASLKSVVVPEGVTTIGKEAFAHQNSLRLVSLPESLRAIGESAFYDCYFLPAIELHNCLTIGANAFDRCEALNLIIPASVTSLGGGNFNDCKSVSIAADNPIYEQTSDGLILTKEESATLVYVPSGKASTIPDRVTTIGSYAFDGCSNETIALSENVTTLAPLAFACTFNLSLSIPASVGSIGEGAFGWSWQGHVTLDEGNPVYEQTEEGAILTRGEHATLLYVPTLEGSFAIPKTVTEIGDYAFLSAPDLKPLALPEGLTRIGDSAFSNNTALTTLSLPTSLKTIGKNAFSNCSNLTSIDIPDGVTTIGEWAFSVSKFEFIKLPKGLTRIEAWTFVSSALREAEIPVGVTFVGAYAFGCPSMTTITIPESVETFERNAFKFCDELETIIFSGKPPPADFPEAWRGKTWRIPSTEQADWEVAKAKYADWGVTFETYTPPITLTFGDAVPTEAQDWLRKLLVEAGIEVGTVTMEAEGAENLAFLRKFGVAPKWKQKGAEVTLLLSDAEAFAALKAADAKGLLIGPGQIKEMAFTQPMIAVEEGGVTLEIGLQTAETLGEWQALTPSMDAPETTQEGRLRFHFTVPETSDAAFYRFVVPEGTHKGTP